MATPFGMMGSPMGAAPMGYDQMPGLPPLSLQGLSALPATQPRPRPAIDRLGPDTDLHKDTLAKLNAMFRYSAGEMRKQHSHWQWTEMQVQAYVRLPDYDRAMQQLQRRDSLPPEPVKVIVPYNYATLHAACTYLANVLLGRKPMFPLLAVRGTTVDKARHMEQALQDGIRQSKGYEVLYQWLWDSLLYGFGAGANLWQQVTGPRITIVDGQRQLAEGLTFAGNKVQNIDPYAFFPDPRVPMSEVNTRGDFVFWQGRQSKTTLKDMEREGYYAHVDAGLDARGIPGGELGPNEAGPLQDVSQRRARIGMAGEWTPSPHDVVSFHSLREGTVRLVPKDWKLGEGEKSEIWKFCILNSKQIVQAEPLNMVHGRHPVFVAEPTTFGYEFGSISLADFIAPFQDLISWHVNSRLENVRAVVNNQFVYDPARIEPGDLIRPAAGKLIRLKKAAAGTPIDQAISQLQVSDVTRGHIQDIQVLRLLADTATGVNDNLRGIQSQGGRRSATEARQAMQAGAGRLGQLAVRVSQQGLQDLAEQQIMNIQQFMPQEMWVEVTGDEQEPAGSRLLTPDMIIGSFNYQVSDGSLPFDKMALAEIYQQGLVAAMQDPELRQNYDIIRLFGYVAELLGAKNIEQFRRQAPQQPGPQFGNPEDLAGQAAQGQVVPVGSAVPAAGSFMQ